MNWYWDIRLGGRIDQAHHDGRAKLALEEVSWKYFKTYPAIYF